MHRSPRGGAARRRYDPNLMPARRFNSGPGWNKSTAFKKIANSLLDRQGFVCAICGEPEGIGTKKSKRLCLDHCHTTKVIREMLCDSCNKGLGQFKDRPERLIAAAAYLLKHKKSLFPASVS